MQTSASWSSLNARFHRDRAELTGHWDPRPERNSLLYVGLSRDPSLRARLACLGGPLRLRFLLGGLTATR